MATAFPQHDDSYDPLADFDSAPGLSWATAIPGTVYQGMISRLPKELQERDIQTKKPKFWEDGQPIMVVVLQLDVETTNGVEPRSVWAKKPSSMFRALGQAQKDAGQRFALGGTLAIRLERLEPSKTPGFSPQKIYAARYAPPVVADPWQAGTTGPSAQPPTPNAHPTPPPVWNSPQPASQPTLPGTPPPASKW